MGGQRNQRRKWIHCFEDVLILIFLTAISEYDQVLAEDNRTNRMKESINLFEIILCYHWFKDRNVVLFLNKKDLLEEKVASGKSPVSVYFPEYSGPDDSYKDIEEFFKNLFLSKNPNPDERKIYTYVTCATDTKNIEVVDVTVQRIIMEEILKGIGIN